MKKKDTTIASLKDAAQIYGNFIGKCVNFLKNVDNEMDTELF